MRRISLAAAPLLLLLPLAAAEPSVALLQGQAGGQALGAAATPTVTPPPRDFQGRYNNTTNTVTLTWETPTPDGSYRYELYRGTDFLATVNGLSFQDTAPPEQVAFYTVQAIPTGSGEDAASLQGSTSFNPRVTLWSIPAMVPVVICAPIIVFVGGPGVVEPAVREECLRP